jgi:20S proteasome subunit alpha 2
VTKGQKLAQQYFLTYREHIPTLRLVQELATVMQEYTQRGLVLALPSSPRVSFAQRRAAVWRVAAGCGLPCGQACTVPGRPQCMCLAALLCGLMCMHVQGSFFAWKAASIGKNMTNAKTFLEKRQVPACVVSRATSLSRADIARRWSSRMPSTPPFSRSRCVVLAPVPC